MFGTTNQPIATPPLALGQGLPPITTVAFPIYLCVTDGCNTFVTPPVVGGEEMGPRQWSLYQELCDSISKKEDKGVDSL